MEAKQILEGNKVIAEFMNLEGLEDRPNGVMWRNQLNDLHPVQYHSSWTWLIPVYNKILLLYPETEGFKDYKSDEGFFLANYGIQSALAVSSVNNQLNIESSWLKLTDFLTWWNKVK